MTKRRQKGIEDLPQSPKEGPGSEPKVPFSVWFDKMLKAGKVRHYQDEALLVFFRKKGLKNSEIETTYNRAFETF